MSDNFLCPLCSFPLPGQSDTPHTWETGKRWEEHGWPEHYQEPRVCTGCGGVHPEDVLRMLKEGWTDEMCDLRHKGYLSPPGLKAEQDAWHRSVEKKGPIIGKGDQVLTHFPSHPIKGPPIKFYIGHFSKEQVAELNKIVKERR